MSDTSQSDAGFESLVQSARSDFSKGSSKIQELREGGFTDEEISQWSLKKRGELTTAGFTDSEINQYLTGGIEVNPNVPAGFEQRVKQGFNLGRVIKRAAQGAIEGFGSEPLGLDPGTPDEKFLQDIGAYADPSKGKPGNLFLESIARPTHIALEAFIRAFPAATRAVGGVAQGVVEELGGSEVEGERAKADTDMLGQLAATVAGTKPTYRLGPNGPKKIGPMPTSESIAEAASAITGKDPDVAVQQKLLETWQSRGVHPDEILAEARTNPEIAQNLLSSNPTELPYNTFVDRSPPPAEGNIRLYRVQPKGDPKGDIPEWVRESEEFKASEAATGRWFASDKSNVEWYVNHLKDDGLEAEVTFLDIPKAEAEQYRVSNLDPKHEARKFSRRPEEEFFLPPEEAAKREALGVADKTDLTTIPKTEAPLEGEILGGGGGEIPPGTTVGAASPEPQGPIIQGVINSSAEELRAARDRILSRVSVGDREAGEKSGGFAKFYENVFDSLYPIQRATAKAGEIDDLNNPYNQYRLLAGSPSKAHHALDYGTIDFNTLETNGKSFKEIMAGVDDIDDFRAFIVSARAAELEGRGIETGIAREDILRYGPANVERYGRIMTELVDYQDRLLQYIRDAGVISEESYQAIKGQNALYIPMHRVFNERHFGIGRGLEPSNPLREIHGSERKIIDPLESIIKNTYLLTVMADRNAAANSLVAMLKRMDEGVEATEVTNVPAVVDPAARQWLGHNGGPAFDTLEDAIDAASSPIKDGQLKVLENGKLKIYDVDPDIARAIKNLDRDDISLAESIMAPFTRAMRTGVVLDPAFLARFAFREMFYAFIGYNEGVLTPIDMAKAIGSAAISRFMGGRFALNSYKEWLKSGGGGVTMQMLDRKYLQEDLDRLLQTGIWERGWNVVLDPNSSIAKKIRAVGKVPLEYLHKVTITPLRAATDITLSASHFAAFQKEWGKIKDAPDRASRMAAAWISRDASIDSARQGAKMRAVNQIWAFSGATIADPDKVFNMFRTHPVATTTKILLGITIPSLILWAATRDDSRVQSASEFTKESKWLVPFDKWEKATVQQTVNRPIDQVRLVGGQYYVNNGPVLQPPKPFGMGTLFGTLPVMLAEEYMMQNPQDWFGFLQAMMVANIPNFLPTMAVPIAEQFANTSTITGAPLIPHRNEGLMAEYQQTQYTTELAKKIGKTIGAFPGIRELSLQGNSFFSGVAKALTSPELIENYINDWSGRMGQYVLMAADSALRAQGLLPNPIKPTAQLADIPVIGGFVMRYPAASDSHIQKFYSTFERNEILFNTWQEMIKRGDPKAAAEVASIGGPRMMIQLVNTYRNLGLQSKIVRDLWDNPELSSSDKRQLIDQIYFGMIQTAVVANKILEKLP